MSELKLSVLMPVYNERKFVREIIESIARDDKKT